MLVVSIVFFKSDRALAVQATKSALASDLVSKVVVVDNSPTDLLRDLTELDHRVSYVFSPLNPGFGVGHNIALDISVALGSKYHLILNPDVAFDGHVLQHLVATMENDKSIGIIMPKVVFPDGRQQHLCKLLPSPLDLIVRRFLPVLWREKHARSHYELRTLPLDRISDVPTLSGCFLLVRNCVIQQVGGFDPRFFMYLEDVDLVRRASEISRTVFDPRVEIVHHYAKGSYKNLRLLSYHIASAIRYFNKWGWIYDRDRSERNDLAVSALYRPLKD